MPARLEIELFNDGTESGQWRPDVVESCLAHADRDDVRRVYNRAGFWQERVALMAWWADYLDALKEADPTN